MKQPADDPARGNPRPHLPDTVTDAPAVILTREAEDRLHVDPVADDVLMSTRWTAAGW